MDLLATVYISDSMCQGSDWSQFLKATLQYEDWKAKLQA